MTPTTWDDLSAKEAKALCARYAASLEPQRTRFAEMVRAAGGPAIGVDRDDLLAIGDFLWKRVRDLEPVTAGPEPVWLEVDRRYGMGWGPGPLLCIDGVSSLVVWAFEISYPPVEWTVGKDKVGADFRKPLLSVAGREIGVFEIGRSVVMSAYETRRDPTFLATWIDSQFQYTRDALSATEPTDIEDDVQIEPYDHPHWTHQLVLPAPGHSTQIAAAISKAGIAEAVDEDTDLVLVRGGDAQAVVEFARTAWRTSRPRLGP